MRKKIDGLLTALTVLLAMAVATSQPGLTASKGAKTKPITLKFGCWDYDRGSGHKEIAEGFMKLHSNVKIDVFDAASTDTDYNDKINIMLASGEKLDVFYARNLDMFGGILLKRQALQLDKFIKRDHYNLKPYGTTVDVLKSEGKIFALPQRANYWLMFYNKDLFDKAKISYPTNNMTWAQFEKTAKLLTSGNGQNKIYGAHLDTYNIITVYVIPGLQRQMGDAVNGDFRMLREPLEMFTRMQLKDKTAVDYATLVSTSTQWRGAFAKGNVAMMPMGTWFLNQCITDVKNGNSKVNWGVVKYPTWDGKTYINATTPTPMVINAKTEYPDMAWEFVKYATGRAGAKILAEQRMFPAYNDKEVMAAFKNNPDIPAEAMKALPTSKLVLEWPVHPLSGLIKKMMGEEIIMCLTGNVTVDECIKKMTVRRAEIIKLNSNNK